MPDSRPQAVLVGHPFIPQGMGEHIRSSFRAFHAGGRALPIRDVYGFDRKDPGLVDEFDGHLTDDLGTDVNIFHVNGDEVDRTLRQVQVARRAGAHAIIYPAWELSKYPEEWARKLDLFDEIWAPSRFVAEALRGAVQRPVFHMPLACDVRVKSFIGRRAFGIPESAFAFLFMFDLASYVQRKNPAAVIEAYTKLTQQLPSADLGLVLKVNGAKERPDEYRLLRRLCEEQPGRIVLINQVLPDDDVKNLVRTVDCLVSLHRSEGFGRALSEAMFFGKPVIGTAYSGNMDFMTADNSYLVNYQLRTVEPGEYPFSEGQVWADPDLDHAVEQMAAVVNHPDIRNRIGEAASRHMRMHFSYRAVGLRYARRLQQIADIRATKASAISFG